MTTGQRCSCGIILPSTWPHADQAGNAACLDCIGSEAKATWPSLAAIDPDFTGGKDSVAYLRERWSDGHEGKR